MRPGELAWGDGLDAVMPPAPIILNETAQQLLQDLKAREWWVSDYWPPPNGATERLKASCLKTDLQLTIRMKVRLHLSAGRRPCV